MPQDSSVPVTFPHHGESICQESSPEPHWCECQLIQLPGLWATLTSSPFVQQQKEFSTPKEAVKGLFHNGEQDKPKSTKRKAKYRKEVMFHPKGKTKIQSWITGKTSTVRQRLQHWEGNHPCPTKHFVKEASKPVHCSWRKMTALSEEIPSYLGPKALGLHKLPKLKSVLWYHLPSRAGSMPLIKERSPVE